jgi:hypothetical protein
MKNLVNFFFKKKEIVLDCFTHVPYAYDYAKIDSSLNYIPEWFKNTPKVEKDENGNQIPELVTIKNCVAFIELYKKGIVIPSWFSMDLKINTDSNTEKQPVEWEASNDMVHTRNSHHPDQFKRYAGPHGGNVKISSPWAFKTQEEIYFTWTQPTWSLRNFTGSLTLLPAVVNYKYNHSTEINYFVEEKPQVQELTIPPLTPLVMLHPMTERTVVIKNHLVTLDEFNRIHGVHRMFFHRGGKDSMGLYQAKKKIIERVESQNEQTNSKCPYTAAKKFISKDNRNI